MSSANQIGMGTFTLLLLLGAHYPLHGKLDLVVGDATGEPGQTVTVPVKLTAEGMHVAGMQFELAFEMDSLTIEEMSPGSALADHRLFWNEVSPGTLRALIFSQTHSSLDNGEIAKVNVTISGGLEGGESALDLKNIELVNEKAETIEPGKVDGGHVVIVSPPTITPIPDQTTEMNVPTATIPFTIGDKQSSVDELNLTKASSDMGLVPEANIAIQGSGADRAVKITPASGQTGTATIEIIVADPDNQRSTSSFLVTVVPASGIEGDVVPLPKGNGQVTISDWVKIGRFVFGLDEITTANQFMRIDIAPRTDGNTGMSLGNGKLTVTDWVQAGRYAVGLDPVVKTGGPIGPFGSASRE